MKRTETSALRKKQILESVCRCLQTKPFHALTIKEIAAEAGIANGLVHFYFESKDKLLTETTAFILKYFEHSFMVLLEPYHGRLLTKDEIKAFFEDWFQLLLSKEYAYYSRIWYDISAQNRFNADDPTVLSDLSYMELVSPAFATFSSQNADYMQVCYLLMTYIDGMMLRIYLYGLDPHLEIQNARVFLNLLLNSIQS